MQQGIIEIQSNIQGSNLVPLCGCQWRGEGRDLAGLVGCPSKALEQLVWCIDTGHVVWQYVDIDFIDMAHAISFNYAPTPGPGQGEISAKLQYWSELPWILWILIALRSCQPNCKCHSHILNSHLCSEFWCWAIGLELFSGGLASDNATDVRETAKKALNLWDKGGPQCDHAMSRRFLDPTWTGLDGGDEVPLRQFTERLAKGVPLESFSDQEQQAIGHWLCRFRHVTCNLQLEAMFYSM